jgi:hypothetical protein
MATPVSTAPTVSVAPATTAPAQSQQPGFLGGLLSGLFGRNNQPGLFGRNPDLPDYADRGLLGKVGMDLAMGLSINPFGDRASQAQSLADRGYSQAEIDGYFGRTDATVAANKAAQENSVGAGLGYVNDLDLIKFGNTLPMTERNAYMGMDRNSQLRRYQQAMGY